MKNESKKFLFLSGERPRNFHGTLRLPSSKSYLHRALFIASLASGTSMIHNCGRKLSEDVKGTLRAISAFGVRYRYSSKRNGTIIVASSGLLRFKSKEIYVGGSGTTARFSIAIAGLACFANKPGRKLRICGDRSFSRRPMRHLLDALSAVGVKCHSESEEARGIGALPVVIEAGRTPARFKEIIRINGSVSSQFVSALLIASAGSAERFVIRLTRSSSSVSLPYIDATIAVLGHFGVRVHVTRSKDGAYSSFKIDSTSVKPIATSFTVPGDLSSAAALGAAAISAGGSITISGIVDSTLPQADYAFFEFARRFGAKVSLRSNVIRVESPDALSGARNLRGAYSTSDSTVRSSHRDGPIRFDLKNCPDLAPVLAALAAATASIPVELTNVGRLRFKESDRVSSISEGLRRLGLNVLKGENSLSVGPPGCTLSCNNKKRRGKPIVLDSFGDHRIFMALVIAALSGRFGGVLISEPECVRKSYPSFVSDIKKLCHGQPPAIRLEKIR
jgi:3-phosphoshikimate 1-carboxyvinyltransferase